MGDYDNLVDIRAIKLRERSSRADNAFFFIEQVGTHTRFKVDRDVVEIQFGGMSNTLSTALANYLQQKNRAYSRLT